MLASDFVGLVLKGDEQGALAELQRDPQLAAARNAQGVSVVCLAVYRQSPQLATALAAERPQLDIFEASCLGDLARVQQLLAADPNCLHQTSPDGFSPIGYSAFFGHPQLLNELLRHGARVDVPSQNALRVCPLHSAAASSDQRKALEMARALLAAGADPNAQQQGGYTALHEAAGNGNLELIELLLSHGADRELRNDKGERPADRAQGPARALLDAPP